MCQSSAIKPVPTDLIIPDLQRHTAIPLSNPALEKVQNDAAFKRQMKIFQSWGNSMADLTPRCGLDGYFESVVLFLMKDGCQLEKKKKTCWMVHPCIVISWSKLEKTQFQSWCTGLQWVSSQLWGAFDEYINDITAGIWMEISFEKLFHTSPCVHVYVLYIINICNFNQSTRLPRGQLDWRDIGDQKKKKRKENNRITYISRRKFHCLQGSKTRQPWNAYTALYDICCQGQ